MRTIFLSQNGFVHEQITRTEAGKAPIARGEKVKEIAMVTRQGQITQSCWSAMLTSDDVFDLERDNGGMYLRQQAVLAPVASATPNDLTKRGDHRRFLFFARRRRALD